MTHKNYMVLSVLIFTLVALAHVWRLSTGAIVMLNGTIIPTNASWLGLILAVFMAIWGWKELKKM